MHLSFPALFFVLISVVQAEAPQFALNGQTFVDQFDQEHTIDQSVRWILFAPDRDAGAQARDFLQTQPAGYLKNAGGVYVADISAMPSLVTRMFALPKMRDYGFAVLLGKQEEQTADWPRAPGQASLMKRNGEVFELAGQAGNQEGLIRLLE